MIKLRDLIKENLESDNYYYHVTLAPYISIIQKTGLKTKGNKFTVSNYKEYSSGKIFLCDTKSLDYWIYKIAEHAFHQFDNENFHDIAVFRILKNKLSNVNIDKIGSVDCRGNSYYVTYDISPDFLEFVKIVNAPY